MTIEQIVKNAFYKGFEVCEKGDANCFTAWREEAAGLLPKPDTVDNTEQGKRFDEMYSKALDHMNATEDIEGTPMNNIPSGKIDKQTWQEKLMGDIKKHFSPKDDYATFNDSCGFIINWIEQNKELVSQELNAKHWKEMWQTAIEQKKHIEGLFHDLSLKNTTLSIENQKLRIANNKELISEGIPQDLKVRVILKARKDFGTLFKEGETMELINEPFDAMNGIVFYPIDRSQWALVSWEYFSVSQSISQGNTEQPSNNDGLNERIATENAYMEVPKEQGSDAIAWIKNVLDWHIKFGVDVGEYPQLIDKFRFAMRYNIMMEEVMEMRDAFGEGDLVGVADAICDQLYVVIGTAIEFGLHDILPQLFAEVHRSNMSKLDENGQPVKREDGKILKSKLFSKPDLEKIIYQNGK